MSEALEKLEVALPPSTGHEREPLRSWQQSQGQKYRQDAPFSSSVLRAPLLPDAFQEVVRICFKTGWVFSLPDSPSSLLLGLQSSNFTLKSIYCLVITCCLLNSAVLFWLGLPRFIYPCKHRFSKISFSEFKQTSIIVISTEPAFSTAHDVSGAAGFAQGVWGWRQTQKSLGSGTSIVNFLMVVLGLVWRHTEG